MGYFNIPWNNVSYVGDVLIDAHIALDLVTDDWAEKGLMVIGKEFSDWALGKHQWSEDRDDLHPFLGCNGDRMTHVAKGTIGIRIDGVENIAFHDLSVHDLHEQSPVGSSLCTEYWSGNMENFFGTGHFLQNEPYLYGHGGNMIHGIFADFTSFSVSGKSEIFNLFSDTGLVYGIGAYTSSMIDIFDNFNVHHLGSGIALLDVDTAQLTHPYHPTIAKPFHIIHKWMQYENVFHSAVNVDDDAHVNVQCIFGRDGVENDLKVDAKERIVVNRECGQQFDEYIVDFVAKDVVLQQKEEYSVYFLTVGSLFCVWIIWMWYRSRTDSEKLIINDAVCYNSIKEDHL